MIKSRVLSLPLTECLVFELGRHHDLILLRALKRRDDSRVKTCCLTRVVISYHELGNVHEIVQTIEARFQRVILVHIQTGAVVPCRVLPFVRVIHRVPGYFVCVAVSGIIHKLFSSG